MRGKECLLWICTGLLTLEKETKALHPVGFEFPFFSVLPTPPHSICCYFLAHDVVVYRLINSIFLIFHFFLELTALCLMFVSVFVLMFVSVSSLLVSNFRFLDPFPPLHFTWICRPYFLFQHGFVRWVPFDTLETIYIYTWAKGLTAGITTLTFG